MRFISLSPRGILNGLKSKVGLAADKTAAMRINLNIDGCGAANPGRAGQPIALVRSPAGQLNHRP
jgi:hypothetical protein